MSKICVSNVIKVHLKELLVTDNFVLRWEGRKRGKKGAKEASGMRSVPIRKYSDSGRNTSPKHVGH